MNMNIHLQGDRPTVDSEDTHIPGCHGLSVYPVWVCIGQSSHSERASAE